MQKARLDKELNWFKQMYQLGRKKPVDYRMSRILREGGGILFQCNRQQNQVSLGVALIWEPFFLVGFLTKPSSDNAILPSKKNT